MRTVWHAPCGPAGRRAAPTRGRGTRVASCPMERAVGYARLGSQRIAYEVFGAGPVDLVVTAGSFSAFDTDWEDPIAELFFRRLASFSRVIRFDRRGAGASDPLPLDALPPWESFVEEPECVMNEVGSGRTAVMTSYEARAQ